MKKPRVDCKLCGRDIVDDWSSRWRHIISVHPDVAGKRLLPLIENPSDAYKLGQFIAEQLKGKLRV